MLSWPGRGDETVTEVGLESKERKIIFTVWRGERMLSGGDVTQARVHAYRLEGEQRAVEIYSYRHRTVGRITHLSPQ